MNQLESLLLTALHDLARHRKRLASLEDCYRKLFKKFQKSHGTLLIDIELQKQALEQVGRETKTLAKTLFRLESRRELCLGVTIVHPKRFIYDIDEAYYYAINSEYRDSLVSLQTREFEKHCLNMAEIGDELPFVDIQLGIEPLITKDLDKALRFSTVENLERSKNESSKP